MTLITAALGWFSFLGIRRAGGLVIETYDLSLQSISYARAAAVDLAGIEAALARRSLADGPRRQARVEEHAAELQRSLQEDLDIVASRARSPEAVREAQGAEQAFGRCAARPPPPLAAQPLAAQPLAARSSPAWPPPPAELVTDADWQTLDRCVREVEGHIETLVEITAGDGFLYRQRALRAIGTSLGLDALAVLAAVGLSGLLTWLLTRRIVGPVRAAAAAARIAEGELETAIPQGREDELGALLAAMAVMRDNIRAMVEAEVTQRRSAQSLLVDAVESTAEGVVLVDRRGRIALANSQAAEFFPRAGALLRAGAPFARLVGPEAAAESARAPPAGLDDPRARSPEPDLGRRTGQDAGQGADHAVERAVDLGVDLGVAAARGTAAAPGTPPAFGVAARRGAAADEAGHRAASPAGYTGEWQLADGRWLRVSRSPTREGGFVEIYSDITELRARRRAGADQPPARRGAEQHVAGACASTTATAACWWPTPATARSSACPSAPWCPGCRCAR